MAQFEETMATKSVHAGCGGTVVKSLDGESCDRCGAELRPEDWRTLDDLLDVNARAWPPSGLPGGTGS